MDRNVAEYDPYALEVVPFASLDQQDFYTMSVRGITHYVDGVSADFASECLLHRCRNWWSMGSESGCKAVGTVC